MAKDRDAGLPRTPAEQSVLTGLTTSVLGHLPLLLLTANCAGASACTLSDLPVISTLVSNQVAYTELHSGGEGKPIAPVCNNCLRSV